MKDVLTKQVQASNATWSRPPAVQADICLITTNIILLGFRRKGGIDSDFAAVPADELQQPQDPQETESCLEEPITDVPVMRVQCLITSLRPVITVTIAMHQE